MDLSGWRALRVPRHLFVPVQLAPFAYHDTPLPIGFDETISQPFISALMTDLLAPEPHEVVLEIGTGLGYQTAVAQNLRLKSGASRLSRSLQILLNCACTGSATQRSVSVSGTGRAAGPNMHRTDKILVTAYAEQLPQALLEQLKPRWPYGFADGLGRGSAAHSDRQGYCWSYPDLGAYPGEVQSARDSLMIGFRWTR